MPSAITTEQLLHAWGVWSRVDVNIGPEVDRAAGSLEGLYRSPQCWDERRPKVVIINNDTAMRVEKAVIGTGVVLAAALRTFYIRQRPPHTRAQVQVLLEAQRRVAVLLGAGCATGVPERPPRRAADAGDARRIWRAVLASVRLVAVLLGEPPLGQHPSIITERKPRHAGGVGER